ncbi:MAG: PIG-L family deacetylase [Actinobacteria bacterium]|nr:PIG-L family deacetylase [Actinomycetota bacterium]
MRVDLRRLTARLAPLVPDAVLDRVLELRSRLGEGPVIGLPRFDRVLVVAPHPDDETLLCGGTVSALADRGADVRVVVATDGTASRVPLAPGELARRRREETRQACATLGVGDPVFVGLRDGDLTAQVGALTDAVQDQLEAFAPHLVLVPWFGDAHPDHRACSAALVRTTPLDEVEVWGGEVWMPAPINRLVDVSETIERKRAALAAHATAQQAFDLEAMLALNRYRSVHGLRGRGFAEGYLAAPFPDYARWTTHALESDAR